jgi:hypothetical protein
MLSIIRYARTHFHPSALLLGLQLMLLILYAVFEEPQGERALVTAFSVVVPMLVIWVVHHSPAIDWIAWILAVPAFLFSVLTAVLSQPVFYYLAALLSAPLYFYAAASLIAYMMEDFRVTIDELYAAGATFTMLAWGFANLFLVWEALRPGSFISSVRPDQSLTFVDLLFVSFTNLSSVGLSDIVPVTTSARVLLMFEQFVGLGYIAVVVSRLVGLTLQQRSRSRS